MVRALRFAIFTLIFILGAVLPAVAQDVELAETYAFDSGSTLSYPDGWTIEDESGDTVIIASDRTRVTLIDFPRFEDLGLAASAQPAAVLSVYFKLENQEQVTFDPEAVEEIELGERSAARYDYEDADGNAALVLIVIYDDETFGLLDAVSLDGEMHEEDIVLAIAESFNSRPQRGVTFGGSAGSASETTTTTTTTTVACTVSTDEARTVHVRVGPGENRTSYAFLPADQEFDVLGQATADDDSVWWKLDREIVAPNAAANEAWVARDDVHEDGDCDAVVDVNAPPIIPIVSAPPPEEPSGGETGEQPAGGEGSTAGAVSPGTWTIVYSNPVPASCIGGGATGETVYLDIPIPAETYSLSISGSGIVYGGQPMTRTASGAYYGLWDTQVDTDTVSSEVTLRAVSATQMRGQMQFTASFGETSCSMTVSVTVTKN